MTTLKDRSAPGVRITLLPDEKAASGTPVDLAGRILSFTYEDCERKADKVSITLDNFDLSLFESKALVGGAVLEVSWGYLRLSDTDHPGSGMKPRTLSTGVALLSGGGQQWHPDEGWRRDAPVAGTPLEKNKRRCRTLRGSGSAKRRSSTASLTAR